MFVTLVMVIAVMAFLSCTKSAGSASAAKPTAKVEKIVWKSDDSTDFAIQKNNKKMIFISEDDENIDNENIFIIKEKKDSLKINKKTEKKIEIIFDDENSKNNDKINIITDEDNFEYNTDKNAEKFVWVYKNNNHKIMIIVSSIKKDDFTNEELKNLNKNNIYFNEKNSLSLKDFAIKFNEKEKFIMSFNLKFKGELNVKIVDLKGNIAYNNTIKKFKGDFEDEINFPENEKEFVIKISSKNKSYLRKIQLERK